MLLHTRHTRARSLLLLLLGVLGAEASEVVDLTDESFDAFVKEHETTMVRAACCGLCTAAQAAADVAAAAVPCAVRGHGLRR